VFVILSLFLADDETTDFPNHHLIGRPRADAVPNVNLSLQSLEFHHLPDHDVVKVDNTSDGSRACDGIRLFFGPLGRTLHLENSSVQ
jgi:hypothetical protein